MTGPKETNKVAESPRMPVRSGTGRSVLSCIGRFLNSVSVSTAFSARARAWALAADRAANAPWLAVGSRLGRLNLSFSTLIAALNKREWKEGRFPKVPGDEIESIALPE